MKKRLLGILLVLVAVIGMIPTAAFAADSGSGSSQTENYGDFIDGEQVINDMIEKNGMYAHPRIIMSEEKFTKLRSHIGDDTVTAILLEKLRKEAEKPYSALFSAGYVSDRYGENAVFTVFRMAE